MQSVDQALCVHTVCVWIYRHAVVPLTHNTETPSNWYQLSGLEHLAVLTNCIFQVGPGVTYSVIVIVSPHRQDCEQLSTGDTVLSLRGHNESCIRRGFTLAPPSEYNEMIRAAAAAMRVAVTSHLVLTLCGLASHQTHRGGLGLGGSVHEEAHYCFSYLV